MKANQELIELLRTYYRMEQLVHDFKHSLQRVEHSFELHEATVDLSENTHKVAELMECCGRENTWKVIELENHDK